MYQLIGIGNW